MTLFKSCASLCLYATTRARDNTQPVRSGSEMPSSTTSKSPRFANAATVEVQQEAASENAMACFVFENDATRASSCSWTSIDP